MPTTTTRLFTATSEPPSTTAPATEIATEEEIPYFVSPLSRDLTTTTTTTTAATVISEPPKIPPPFEFDDPVNLAVVVSWVSKKQINDNAVFLGGGCSLLITAT